MKVLFVSILICAVVYSSTCHDSYSSEVPIPPLKQIREGSTLQDITCKADLKLIFKIYDGSPACVTPSTAENLIQRQTHTTKIPNHEDAYPEYRMLSWQKIPEEQEDYIVHMLWINRNSDPVQVAKKSMEKPEGYAAIFLGNFAEELYTNPRDRCINPAADRYLEFQCPWLDKGIASTKQMTTEWFEKYKESGGRLDYLILDDEFSFSNWSLQKKPGWAEAIEEDPRFATLVPKINQTSLDSVINRPHINHPGYLQWNAVLDKMLVDARNKAIFEPIKKLYPDIKASNYNDYVVTRDKTVPEENGHMQYHLANFGTHNSKSFYGNIGNYAAKIGNDSDSILQWEISQYEAIRDSSDIPTMAWVPYFSYSKSNLVQEDYEKMLLYLICSTEEPLLFWNPNAPITDNKLAYEIVLQANKDGCNTFR